MMRFKLLIGMVACMVLAGCGGMNRAIGVVPNTMDDLQARTEPYRQARTP